jgi:hypothetical protein
MDRRIEQFYAMQDRRRDRKRKKRTRSFADKIYPYAKLIGTIIFLLLIAYTIYTYITIERIY